MTMRVKKRRPQRSLKAPNDAVLQWQSTIIFPRSRTDRKVRHSIETETRTAPTTFNITLTGIHPLSAFDEVPPLTDIQILITQAILHHGEPANVDQIYDYVSERWRDIKLRKKDGTPYDRDCRRAIQANLLQSNATFLLFTVNYICALEEAWKLTRPELQKDDASTKAWRLVRTLEEATRPPPSRASEASDSSSRGATPPVLQLSAKAMREARDLLEGTKTLGKLLKSRSDEDDEENPLNIPGMDVINKEPSEEVWEKITQERRQRLWDELQIDATELDPPTNPPPGAIVLTELQHLISEAILLRQELTSVEDVYSYACKYWGEMRNSNGSTKVTDCRRAIITSLTKNSISSAPIFERGGSGKESLWKLGPCHPWLPITPRARFGNLAPHL